MIRRKTQMGILVLAGLVALSYWASRDQKVGQQQPIDGLDTRLDYALSDFEYQFFDLDGLLSASMTAPELATDENSGISQVSNPVFIVIDHGISWRIIAESATVSADKDNIVLSGDVWIHRPATDSSGPLNINTSELTIEVGVKIASSERPVRLMEDNDIMEAVGFRINMMENRLQLLNRVKLTYAVNQ